MIYCFDLDGTLCTTPDVCGEPDYNNAKPRTSRIAAVNTLKAKGHTILIDSARGSVTGQDWSEFTKAQLAAWGLQFDQVRTGVKFFADRYVDDKGVWSEDYF